jgi:hypothetical protein
VLVSGGLGRTADTVQSQDLRHNLELSKARADVRRMICGPGVAICEECVRLCVTDLQRAGIPLR